MKKIISLFIFVLIAFCFFHFGCKSSTELFTLTVITNDGISGFPEAGVYTHEHNSTIFYNYSASGAIANPVLTLNDQNAPLNGNIFMDRNYTLVVSCDALDYNGEWIMSTNWEMIFDFHSSFYNFQTPEDSSNMTISITHSTDSLAINIPYPLPWYPEGFELTGEIFDESCFKVLKRQNWIEYGTSWNGNNTLFDLEYRITGTFTSSTELQGQMGIVVYRTRLPAEQHAIYFYQSPIRGVKK